MTFTPAEALCCHRLATLALEEDLGNVGDLTSLAVIPAELEGAAVLVARAPGTLAGLPAAEMVFSLVDGRLSFVPLLPDGSAVERGARLATVRGPMRSILTGERVALNFVQRLSGV